MLLSTNYAPIDQICLEEVRSEESEFERQYRWLGFSTYYGRHLESQIPPDVATPTRYYTSHWQCRWVGVNEMCLLWATFRKSCEYKLANFHYRACTSASLSLRRLSYWNRNKLMVRISALITLQSQSHHLIPYQMLLNYSPSNRMTINSAYLVEWTTT